MIGNLCSLTLASCPANDREAAKEAQMSQSTTLGSRPTTGSQAARLSWLALVGLIVAIIVIASWPAGTTPVSDAATREISPTMAYVREAGVVGVGEGVGALTHVREAPATSRVSQITPTNVGEREGPAS